MLSRLTFTAALALTAGLGATASRAQPQDQDLIDRGAYLNMLAGCVHCHQARGGDAYAGGRVLITPFGKLMSPNITQDTATGIGTWTRDDFEGALRRGVNKEGLPLYPAMPYNAYTKLSDEDIDALWAFYQTIEPVENEVEVIQLPFPYNVRRAVTAWKIMYFEEERFQPDPEQSDMLNHGEYLVEGLVHCASCHTSRNAIGGPIEDQAYQGAAVDGWYAPNISGTEGSALNKFDQDMLVSYLRDEHPDGLAAFGPMVQVTESLIAAEEGDVTAIAAYILDRAEGDPEGSPAELEDLSDEAMARGQAVYEANCLSCHGEDGMGSETVAARLVNNGGVNAKSPVNVANVLILGIEPRGEWGLMPSYAAELEDEEIADVTNYIRRAWGNNGAEVATPAFIESRRSIADLESGMAVELASSCPTADTSMVSDSTRQQITGLANQMVEARDLEQAATGIETDMSDVGYSQKLTAMTAIYCNALATTEPPLEKDTVLERQLAFINTIDDALRGIGAGPGGDGNASGGGSGDMTQSGGSDASASQPSDNN